jgi:DUF4097 and DUF4098 domain-containing protein YvlB
MTTFDTPTPVQLTVDLALSAEIHVRAVAGTESEVVVTPRSASRALDVRAAEEARVDLVAGRLSVVLHPLRRFLWSDGGAVEVTVRVPIGSDVHLESGAGHLRCQGELGAIRAHTGSGDIRVEHCGPITAKTDSGDVVVERVVGAADLRTDSGTLLVREVEGDARLRSAHGEVVAGVVTGALEAKSSHGRVVVDRATGPATLTTAHGNLVLGHVERGVVELRTASGSIEVGVADGVATWLDLRTGYGAVRSDLQASAEPAPGEPSVELHAKTSYGDITVRRSPVTSPTPPAPPTTEGSRS